MSPLTKRDRQVRRWVWLAIAVILGAFWGSLIWVATR